VVVVGCRVARVEAVHRVVEVARARLVELELQVAPAAPRVAQVVRVVQADPVARAVLVVLEGRGEVFRSATVLTI
jgi:hypothetical protein